MDASTVRTLVTVPAVSAIASQVYVACVLDLEFTGLLRLATVTMQLEGGGYFGASNWNTDRCGLSFGLIQWAQRPGRLHELLAAFDRADPNRFASIFGAGDRDLAEGLLAHTARPNGGVDPATGRAVDSRFEMTIQPWRDRWRAAGTRYGVSAGAGRYGARGVQRIRASDSTDDAVHHDGTRARLHVGRRQPVWRRGRPSARHRGNSHGHDRTRRAAGDRTAERRGRRAAVRPLESGRPIHGEPPGARSFHAVAHGRRGGLDLGGHSPCLHVRDTRSRSRPRSRWARACSAAHRKASPVMYWTRRCARNERSNRSCRPTRTTSTTWTAARRSRGRKSWAGTCGMSGPAATIASGTPSPRPVWARSTS